MESVEERLTYAQLWEEVRALAGYLQERCRVRTGDRILLLYPPCIDFIIGLFACHAAGAIAVPAYPPRRNRKASRIRSIVVDADARWALSTGSVVDMLTGGSAPRRFDWRPVARYRQSTRSRPGEMAAAQVARVFACGVAVHLRLDRFAQRGDVESSQSDRQQ